MEPIRTLRARSVALPAANIDTDQIVPARFLKGSEKKGLGKALFADWRYAPDGTPRPDFPLNRSGAQGAAILVAGDNYGCGSSREHAAWAMADFGLRAVISTSIADIHRQNLLQNGILPVVVDPETHREALAAAERNLEFEIDLPSQTLRLPSGRTAFFPLDPFVKRCLLQGMDELGYLLSRLPEIEAYERARGAGSAAEPS